ncbi:MAG: prenyltransferase [Clostridia bacterium]|nr:prenyltransferase [Clostridia bacterium]
MSGTAGSSGFVTTLEGLGRLFRLIPVLSWTGGGFLIGTAVSLRFHGGRGDWTALALALLAGLLIQGFIAHAYNDYEDWRSGTDRVSPGVLSGGSGVIPLKKLREGALPLIGLVTAGLVILIGVYLIYRVGPLMGVFLLVGLWAGIGYSSPPLRMAYRPFLGEWAVAFPAVVACVLAPGYLIGYSLPGSLWLAAVTHGLFCLGWLMQHHLADREADLGANPPKITTVVKIGQLYGAQATRWVAAGYYGIIIPWAVGLGYGVDPVYFGSAALALSAALLGLATNPDNIRQITVHEVAMIALTMVNAGWLAGYLRVS